MFLLVARVVVLASVATTVTKTSITSQKNSGSNIHNYLYEKTLNFEHYIFEVLS